MTMAMTEGRVAFVSRYEVDEISGQPRDSRPSKHLNRFSLPCEWRGAPNYQNGKTQRLCRSANRCCGHVTSPVQELPGVENFLRTAIRSTSSFAAVRGC